MFHELFLDLIFGYLSFFNRFFYSSARNIVVFFAVVIQEVGEKVGYSIFDVFSTCFHHLSQGAEAVVPVLRSYDYHTTFAPLLEYRSLIVASKLQ